MVHLAATFAPLTHEEPHIKGVAIELILVQQIEAQRGLHIREHPIRKHRCVVIGNELGGHHVVEEPLEGLAVQRGTQSFSFAYVAVCRVVLHSIETSTMRTRLQ